MDFENRLEELVHRCRQGQRSAFEELFCKTLMKDQGVSTMALVISEHPIAGHNLEGIKKKVDKDFGQGQGYNDKIYPTDTKDDISQQKGNQASHHTSK